MHCYKLVSIVINRLKNTTGPMAIVKRPLELNRNQKYAPMSPDLQSTSKCIMAMK